MSKFWDGLPILRSYEFLIGEGTVHFGLSAITFLSLYSWRKKYPMLLNYVVVPWCFVFVIRSIIFLGFSSNHSYYQFPYLPVLAMGSAVFFGSIFQIIFKKFVLRKISNRILNLTLILMVIFIGIQYANKFVKPLYLGWSPAAVNTQDQAELQNFLKSKPRNIRCIGNDFWVSNVCDGEYFEYPQSPIEKICIDRNLKYYSYIIGNTTNQLDIKFQNENSIEFRNDSYFVVNFQ
ncbi:MAG: hypothetical protein IPL83_21005 [Bdellovibrionales bacterium]|nr:hypothetical protein [Bdellovibrionales bacterium]